MNITCVQSFLFCRRLTTVWLSLEWASTGWNHARNGICFAVTSQPDTFRFAPSRFVAVQPIIGTKLKRVIHPEPAPRELGAIDP